MARFWLATFEMTPPAGLAPSAATPLAVEGARGWAIEVIQAGNEAALLFSTVDDPARPTKLQCRIGFVNDAKSCNIWSDRGFPLVDAIIKLEGDAWIVCSPCFLVESALNYEAELITIRGATLDGGADPRNERLNLVYEQVQIVPDAALPATFLRRRPITWTPGREGVGSYRDIQLDFGIEAAARYPSLAPFTQGQARPVAVWTGTIGLPSLPDVSRATERTNRVDTFGMPAFRFEDVEVLGFRINIDDHGVPGDETFASLIERLNFHLKLAASKGHAPLDFRYRPATRTVVLELLRYGRMRLQEPSLPLTIDDFQSQHELMVRVLVGRVDDDTAQAHDPATYVPAIFVDNAWSKMLGRNAQGFDKWMADFCVRHNGTLTPLRPDGRLSLSHSEPEELGRIAQIDLLSNTGKRPSEAALLKIDCPFEMYEGWDKFEEIDLDLALSTSALAPTRWRQSDFDGSVEFRRSFARSAIPETLKGLRSIQVSPIGDRELREVWKEETAWITGTFVLDDGALIARPNGVVGLTFCAQPNAPKAWKGLCNLLGIAEGGEGTISLPTGSWYRMRCSMSLRIDNDLDY